MNKKIWINLLIFIILVVGISATTGDNVAKIFGTAYFLKGTIQQGNAGNLIDGEIGTFWDDYLHTCQDNTTPEVAVEVNWTTSQIINKTIISVLCHPDYGCEADEPSSMSYYNGSHWVQIPEMVNWTSQLIVPISQQDVNQSYDFANVQSNRFRLNYSGNVIEQNPQAYLCLTYQAETAVGEWMLFNTSGFVNIPPVIDIISVNATSKINSTLDNWIGYYEVSDIDSTILYNTTWFTSDNKPILELIPFNTGTGKNFGTDNDAIISPTTDCMTQGAYGYGCKFDGKNSTILLANRTQFNTSSSTFHFWAKRNQTGKDHTIIGDIADAGDRAISFDSFDYLTVETHVSNDRCRVNSSEYIVDTDWHSYTIVLKDKNCTFYQDGTLINARDHTLDQDTILFMQSIGASQNTRYFNGSIDEFYIWQYPLSRNQVILIENQTYNILHSEETMPNEDWSFHAVTSDAIAYSDEATINFKINQNNAVVKMYFEDEGRNQKTVFDEGENFYVLVNYTFGKNGSSISTGECNITLIDGILENRSDNINFTICTSGCDYDTYYEEFIFHENESAVSDTLHFQVCHENNPNKDLTVKICNTEQTINSAQITNCPTLSTIIVPTTNCIIYNNVNATFNNSAGSESAHRIKNLAIDRKYSEHLNEFGVDVFYNTTNMLFQTSHLHEYYEHGLKDVYTNCSNQIVEQTNSTSGRLVIVNTAPVIILNEVIQPNDEFIEINETTINRFQFYNGTYQWIINIVDDDIDLIQYKIYNSSNDIIFYNQSTIPVVINTGSNLFIDQVNNNYNFSIYVNDTNSTYDFASFLFNITDTILPMCAPLINVSVINNSAYTTNINCYDEYFWSFSLNCTGLFNFTDIGIGQTEYNFNRDDIIAKQSYCNYRYCDGHTKNEIKPMKIKKEMKDNKLQFDEVTISTDQDVEDFEYEKKLDRYSFCIKPKKLEKYITININESCILAPNSPYQAHYVCGDKWLDFEGEKIISYMDHSIVIDADYKEKVCFESIGELNCVEGDYYMIPIPEPQPPFNIGTVGGAITFIGLIFLMVFLIFFAEYAKVVLIYFIVGIFLLLFAVIWYLMQFTGFLATFTILWLILSVAMILRGIDLTL